MNETFKEICQIVAILIGVTAFVFLIVTPFSYDQYYKNSGLTGLDDQVPASSWQFTCTDEQGKEVVYNRLLFENCEDVQKQKERGIKYCKYLKSRNELMSYERFFECEDLLNNK